LELIQHILQHCGQAFQSDERIVGVVRDFLCVSLLSNCTSQIAQVTGLSLQIFVSLLKSFKDHLKSEVEVFITGIFLRILESENSSYDHKLRVLEVFYIICLDPSALVEIFINYDCDMEAIDLFRRMVDGFSKIAKVSLFTTIVFIIIEHVVLCQ
jgi:brefeldin A-inhibited guanine nucleotide-exchange protein